MQNFKKKVKSGIYFCELVITGFVLNASCPGAVYVPGHESQVRQE